MRHTTLFLTALGVIGLVALATDGAQAGTHSKSMLTLAANYGTPGVSVTTVGHRRHHGHHRGHHHYRHHYHHYHRYHGWHPPVVIPFPGHPPVVHPPVRVYRPHPKPYHHFYYRGRGFGFSFGF